MISLGVTDCPSWSVGSSRREIKSRRCIFHINNNNISAMLLRAINHPQIRWSTCVLSLSVLEYLQRTKSGPLNSAEGGADDSSARSVECKLNGSRDSLRWLYRPISSLALWKRQSRARESSTENQMVRNINYPSSASQEEEEKKISGSDSNQLFWDSPLGTPQSGHSKIFGSTSSLHCTHPPKEGPPPD